MKTGVISKSFKETKIKENRSIDTHIINIISTIKEFNWKLIKIWVENNCIYADVNKENGITEKEGLYAASDFDLNDVYRVYSKLAYTLNFNGMLVNDNIMI